MSDRDAFGRETDDETPAVQPAAARAGGLPRWLLPMIALDTIIVIAVLAYFLL